MSANNSLRLIGRLTRDVELRYTNSGKAVTDLGLAVDGRNDGDTLFIDCTAWGKTAELADKYLEKGRMVALEGRVTMDSWDDRETGQKRSKLKMTVDDMQFLGGKGDSERSGSGGPREDRRQGTERAAADYAKRQSREEFYGDEVDDQDPPF